LPQVSSNTAVVTGPMATGGCGDVLTGIITALVCQGLSPFDAAALGVAAGGTSQKWRTRRIPKSQAVPVQAQALRRQ